MDTAYEDPLTALPSGATVHSVTAMPARMQEQPCLKVELRDEVTLAGKPGTDYVDMPTLVLLPIHFATGVIEVDLCAQLNRKTDFDARGFAGLAFHVADDLSQFEAVYIRALNGLSLETKPPRNRRAIQYFAYPDWKFDRLRTEYPDGRYEAGADVSPSRWAHLSITVTSEGITTFLDGQQVLHIDTTLQPRTDGAVGLWTDIGTEAYFRDLRVHAGDLDSMAAGRVTDGS